MRVLLDTATVIWISANDPRLSRTAVDIYEDPANAIFVSVASLWQYLIKVKIGKMPPPPEGVEMFPWHLQRADRLTMLSVEERDVLKHIDLPMLHNDPFDRLLVCQAISRGLTLLTPDHQIRQYAVHTIW